MRKEELGDDECNTRVVFALCQHCDVLGTGLLGDGHKKQTGGGGDQSAASGVVGMRLCGRHQRGVRDAIKQRLVYGSRHEMCFYGYCVGFWSQINKQK